MPLLTLYIALEILVAVACCLGNLLVIWAVWMNQSLRQPTFYFVVSLAVADFLVGMVAIPLAVVLEGEVMMPFGGCLFICCVVLVLTQSSVLSLLAIAVDRYLRVHMSLRYKSITTQRHSWLAVTLCWFIACILGFIPLFGWNNSGSPDNKNDTIQCNFVDVMDMSYMVFNFFGCILPPLLAMILLYVYVFNNLSRHLRENSVGSRESCEYYKKEHNLAQSLALVLVLFAVCWLPLHLMNCIVHFSNIYIPDWVFYIGILLSHINSAVNPVVYAFKIRKIRRAYLVIWRRYVLCQSEEGSEPEQSADIIGSSNPNTIPQSERPSRIVTCIPANS